MVRKKVEGDEEQRRAASREARREGEVPSARGVTTGASKQPGSQPGGTEAGAEVGGSAAEERDFTGRGRPGYTEAHERVFQAIAEAEQEHGGEGVTLDEAARRAGVPKDQTRTLLHDLTQTHRLVTELAGADEPDLGPRYETKPRL